VAPAPAPAPAPKPAPKVEAQPAPAPKPPPPKAEPSSPPAVQATKPSSRPPRCAELFEKGSKGTLTIDDANFLRQECR
jgi:hypothetical protein